MLGLLTHCTPFSLPPSVETVVLSQACPEVSHIGPMAPHPLHARELVSSYLLGLGLNGTSSRFIPLIFCLNNAPSNLVFSYYRFLFIFLWHLTRSSVFFWCAYHLSLLLESKL